MKSRGQFPAYRHEGSFSQKLQKSKAVSNGYRGKNCLFKLAPRLNRRRPDILLAQQFGTVRYIVQHGRHEEHTRQECYPSRISEKRVQESSLKLIVTCHPKQQVINSRSSRVPKLAETMAARCDRSLIASLPGWFNVYENLCDSRISS